MIQCWWVRLNPIQSELFKNDDKDIFVDPFLQTPADMENAMIKICPYNIWIPRYRKIIEDVFHKHTRVTELCLNDTTYSISVTLDDGQGGNIWTYMSRWKEECIL